MFSCFSQSSSKELFPNKRLFEKKGKLYFNLSTELRITPLPIKDEYFNEISPAGFFTNVDKLHSGTALGYGIEYFLTENLSLGFDHFFRYESVLYDFYSIEQDLGAVTTEKTLLQDLSLHINYTLKTFSDNSELFIRVGYTNFHGGSDFLVKYPIAYDDNGEPVLFTENQVTYNNGGYNLALGYRSKRTSMLMGTYFSQAGPFYEVNFSIITPYLRITYQIGKL